MRSSTGFILIGLVILAFAATLFIWGTNANLAPAGDATGQDPMRRIAQVAGGTGVVGLIAVVAGVVLRMRGR